MIQILQRRGYKAGIQSMDKKPLPYDMSKSALHDRRVACPDHPKLFDEIISLERDEKTGKVDHNPLKSKDISDALAGVVYSLSMQRATWVYHDVPHWALESFQRKSFRYKSDSNPKIKQTLST